jgi:uncharacterized protein YeeX (DUF496 family)
MRFIVAGAVMALACAAVEPDDFGTDEVLSLLQTHAYVRSSEAPVCQLEDVQRALAQMSGDCSAKVTNAVAKNTPLPEKERCLCYLEVNDAVAASLQCRTMQAKTHTLAQEYKLCQAGARNYASDNKVCALPKLKPHIDTMSEDCKTTVYKAIETETPMSRETRCRCYSQVSQTAARTLTCHSMPGKNATVWQEYQQCAGVQNEPQLPPVCEMKQVKRALDQMHGDCATRVTDAVLSNTPLTDERRCFCYIQVDDAVATDLTCRTMPAKTHTLAQEHKLCKYGSKHYGENYNICSVAKLKPHIDKMSPTCQDTVYNAIETATPMSPETRCSCYLQVDEPSARNLTCHSMKDKTSTVWQEYQQCKQSSSE